MYFQRQEGENGKVLVQQDANGREPNLDALNGMLIEATQISADAKDKQDLTTRALRELSRTRRAHAQEAKKKNDK